MDASRVLQVVVGGKDFNGVTSFLYQHYKNFDTDKVVFDFLFIKENSLGIRREDPVFAESKFFVLNATKTKGQTDHVKMVKGVSKCLSKNHYDIVHINTLSIKVNVLLLRVCKQHNIKVVISHSHNELPVGSSIVKKFVYKSLQSYIVRNANYLFACSLKAGETLFGKKGIMLSKFRIINNAIDPKVFGFSEAERNRTREMLQVGKKTIIGQIGRLSTQKNQIFAIDVFENMHKKVPNTEFWIIGSGPDEKKLKDLVLLKNLDSVIRFLGQRNDINALLNAMDVLLVPSLWEGLSVATVEAQATGIPVLASSNLTSETAITDTMHLLELDKGAQVWADTLIQLIQENQSIIRTDRHQQLREHGFTIEESARALQDFYCTCL